jgi:hypothetical protein
MLRLKKLLQDKDGLLGNRLLDIDHLGSATRALAVFSKCGNIQLDHTQIFSDFLISYCKYRNISWQKTLTVGLRFGIYNDFQ